MSGGLAGRAAALRESFDRGFTAPRQNNAVDVVDILAISVAGVPYAIRLAEIASLSTGQSITAIPGQPAALLGLAGFRGAMLPVYVLAVLLGHEAAATPGWLVRVPPVAFAFAQFDGHLRLPAARIVPQADGSVRHHICGFLDHAGARRPLLDMSALCESVRILAEAMGKEQNQA